MRKGIILSGGTGSRLFPATIAVTKQLLPIYDKPMVYYPLSVLMLAGIRDILLISTPDDIALYERLLADGSHLGISISYAVQSAPEGLAQAFVIGADFIDNDPVAMVLGDNIFFGHELQAVLTRAAARKSGASVFGYYVDRPEAYGIVEFGEDAQVLSIEEKPEVSKSNWAVTGLYFYDNDVVAMARNLRPSKRGELEITDINNLYLQRGDLFVESLGRGFAWFDAGTHADMLDASVFVSTVQRRQGQFIACLEEISYRMGLITTDDLLRLAKPLEKTAYGKYMINIAEKRL